MEGIYAQAIAVAGRGQPINTGKWLYRAEIRRMADTVYNNVPLANLEMKGCE
jgi:hypothetical protein